MPLLFNPRFMSTSLYLAQFLGVMMAAVGLGILLNQDWYKKMLADIVKSPALMAVAGMFTVLLGTFLVLSHNVWEGGFFPILITVLCWATLLKGLTFVLVPHFQVKMIKWASGIKNYMVAGGIIVLAIGVYLLYMGFYA